MTWYYAVHPSSFTQDYHQNMDSEALHALRWPAAVLLICLSALFAELTLGMLSLDKIELEVVAAGEDKKLANCAQKIIPVRKNGNLLLCTFLIGNTACNSLASILMADLEGGLVGFLVSTFAILIFAEIIPQAVCSRYALEIGARVILIVKVFLVLFYPLSKPVSLLLDLALGEEIGTIHTRQELSKLLQIHVTRGAIDTESGNILQGTLFALNKLKVLEIMTPVENCYMLHISRILDFPTMSEIFETGYSRIPVYDTSKNDVVALLFAKDLVLVDPDDQTPLRYFISIFGRPCEVFPKTTPVREAFVRLKRGHSHLALVVDQPEVVSENPAENKLLGVVTLEDIVEEIIQGDILDETDHDHSRAKRLKQSQSKFRLLCADCRDSLLSPEEVKALIRHISQNVPEIFNIDPPITVECLRWIVQQSEVELCDNPNRDIYAAGVKADFALIVLTGRLDILSTSNQLINEAGSLSILGAAALITDTFVPSFTARIGSETARFVKIKKSVFDAGRKVFLVNVAKQRSTSGPDVVSSPSGANVNVRLAFASKLFKQKKGTMVGYGSPSEDEDLSDCDSLGKS